MLYRSWIVKFLCVATLAFGSVACSSDSTTAAADDDGDADTEASTEEELGTTLAQTTVEQAVTVGGTLDASVSSPELRFTVTELECTDGGTISIDDETFTFSYDACTIVDGDETIVMDGTLTIDGDGDSFSMIFDLTSETTDSDSVATFSISGTISASVSDGTATVTYENFEASVEDTLEGSYDMTADGELTMEGSIVNGDLTVTVNEETVSCTFTDFDTSTATEDDWDDACTVTS